MKRKREGFIKLRGKIPFSISHPVGRLLCMSQFLRRARGWVWGNFRETKGELGGGCRSHLTEQRQMKGTPCPAHRVFSETVLVLPPERTLWLSSPLEIPWRPNSERANVQQKLGPQACLPHPISRPQGRRPWQWLAHFPLPPPRGDTGHFRCFPRHFLRRAFWENANQGETVAEASVRHGSH